MRIGIFHDYFGAIGGAERIVLTIAKILDADIITTDIDAVRRLDPSARIINLGKTIHVAPSSRFPPLCCFISPIPIKTMIYSSSVATGHIIFPGGITQTYGTAITQLGFFYDQYPSFLQNSGMGKRILAMLWIGCHRFFDQRSVKNIDIILANSQNVQTGSPDFMEGNLKSFTRELTHHVSPARNMVTTGSRLIGFILKNGLNCR